MVRQCIIFIALFVVVFESCSCAPYQDNYGSRNQLQDRKHAKKDIFISRGWGAGGMPFSVLYMNPTFSSPKASAAIEAKASYKSHQHQAKSLPQVRTSMRQKSLSRTPHSVIPQLFVSYGWGPLGK